MAAKFRPILGDAQACPARDPDGSRNERVTTWRVQQIAALEYNLAAWQP